jgi:hypothetical protein
MILDAVQRLRSQKAIDHKEGQIILYLNQIGRVLDELRITEY